MTTKEEFEKLDYYLGVCLASVNCGVDLSEVDSLLFATIRRKCEELSSELVVLE